MARPLRLEFPGAVYDVTARGDQRKDIFLDDRDRQRFLELLRPSADQILKAIAKEYGIPKTQALARSNGIAFRQAVHRLRRRCNLPLREVAALACVSVSRVSQIQGEIEEGNTESRPEAPAGAE